MHNELLTYHRNDEVPPEPKNLSRSDRYVLYKVGPVLAANVSSNNLQGLPWSLTGGYIKGVSQWF